MNENAAQLPAPNSIDLFRISRSKEIADVCANTIRKYNREYGLRIYYCGGAAWISKSELEAIIRAKATTTPKGRVAANVGPPKGK